MYSNTLEVKRVEIVRVEYIHVRKADLGDLFLQSSGTGMGDNRASAAVGHNQFGLLGYARCFGIGELAPYNI